MGMLSWLNRDKTTDNDIHSMLVNDPDRLLAALRAGEIKPDRKLFGGPLLLKAVSQDRLEIVDELLKQGVDPNIEMPRSTAERGMTALHFLRSPEMVDLLASHGADMNKPFKGPDKAWLMHGETALHHRLLPASQNKAGSEIDLRIAEAMISHGARLDLPFSKEEFKYSSNTGQGARVHREFLTPAQCLADMQNAYDKANSHDRMMVIELDTTSAAFNDSDLLAHEEAGRVLKDLSRRIGPDSWKDNRAVAPLEDANGNVIGQARMMSRTAWNNMLNDEIVDGIKDAPGHLRLSINVKDMTGERLADAVKAVGNALANDSYARDLSQRADWGIDWDYATMRKQMNQQLDHARLHEPIPKRAEAGYMARRTESADNEGPSGP